jgi:hypothetical protein
MGKANMPKGRKPLYREDMVRQAELFGALSLELKDVADVFDITPATLCRYQKIHPELKEAFERGRTKLKDLVGRKYIEKIEQGHWGAIQEGLRHILGWPDTPLIEQSIQFGPNFQLAERLKDARERRDKAIALAMQKEQAQLNINPAP